MGFGFKVLRWSTPSFLQTTNVLWVHEGRPDRAEGTLYVQSTCMDVQGLLCTVTLKGRPCTRPSVSNSEWNAWTQMRPDEKQSCASKHMNWNRRRATQHCKTMGTREHTEPYHHWNQLYKNTKGQQKRARVTALMGARLWTKQNQQPIGKQPIDQSIDRSVDQSINPINQSIDESISIQVNGTRNKTYQQTFVSKTIGKTKQNNKRSYRQQLNNLQKEGQQQS